MRKSKRSMKGSGLKRSSTIRNYAPIFKNIWIKFDDFTELVEDFDVADCMVDRNLSLKKLLRKLEKNCQYFTKDKTIKFYLENGDIWTKFPKLTATIDEQDFLPYDELKFQMTTEANLIDVVMSQNQISDEDEAFDDDDLEQEGKCRRLKERKIKHVIEKVLKWRELYAGILNGQDGQDKIPLDEGAKMVNISKKTLDDYLAQLIKGRKYGFNFNQHKNQKIGVLRQFIRKYERKGQK